LTDACTFGSRLEQLQKEMEEVKREKAEFEAKLSSYFVDACFDARWKPASWQSAQEHDEHISACRILKTTAIDKGLIEKIYLSGDYVSITQSNDCFSNIHGEPMPLLAYQVARQTVMERLTEARKEIVA
jgi:hypothetical protein